MLCLLTLLPRVAGETVTLSHIKGEVEFPCNPQRIAVLDYAILDNIQSLGIEVDLATSKKNMPDYLGKYRDAKYIDLGGLKEFNLETINQFKPEVIFISMRQSLYYDELSAIAPVYISNASASDPLAEIKKGIEAVAKTFKKESSAAQQIAEIDNQIAKLKEKASQSPKKALLVLSFDGRISAFGADSRYGIVFKNLGVKNAGAEHKASSHGQKVNYEYIAVHNPDILYVLDRALAIGKSTESVNLAKNPLVKSTKAARTNQIISLSPQVWYLVNGGIHATKVMLEEIAKPFTD